VSAQISQFTAVGLWIGAVLLLVQVYRAPEDIPLRYFAGVVLLLAVQNTMVVHQHDTSAAVRLVANLLGVAAGFAKVGFFLTALGGATASRAVWRREAVLAGLVMVVATTAFLLAPGEIRPAIGQPKNGGHPAAFVFVASIMLYLTSVSARTVAWTVHLIPRLSRSAFRAGLVLVGLAAVISLCAGVLKLFTAVTAISSGPPIAAVQDLYPLIVSAVPVGYVAFLLGATAPMVDGAARALFAALKNRSNYQTLGPLWAELHDAFPSLRLRTGGGALRRSYRRVVEIRDALVQLAPYYDRSVAARSREIGYDEIRVQAELIRAALVAQRADRPAVDPCAIPQSGASNWQDEVTWLVRLASAFAATPAGSPPPGTASAAGQRR
jgi:hypothetical protein